MFSTIGIIFDIILVLLFVIFGIMGLKKGFFKSVLSIFNFGLCITIAFFTAKYVATWINALYDFSGLIGNNISNSLINSNEFFAQSINIYESVGSEALISAIPDNVNGLLVQLIKIVFSNGKVDMSSTESIGSVIGLSLGKICMVIIAGILVFIVLTIAVALLTRILDNLSKTKVIGGLNKILGFVFGLVKAGLILFIVNVVLVALSLVPPVNKLINPIIQENTYIEKVVYNSTDKLFEKYVVEGDLINKVVGDLWGKR